MDLSGEEAHFIVEQYFHSSSFKIVQEQFHATFGEEHGLQNTMMKQVVDYFYNEHTIVR